MSEAEQITRASRSNLALTFLALPPERRHDISTFYAFCRIVDDIADGEATRAEKDVALKRWRQALRQQGEAEPAFATEVRALIQKYSLPIEHFEEILAGVVMDLDSVSYATWDDLRLYCHRVASVVGLVSIEIFGARDPASRDYALNLGLALQITNILRDVGEDFANGGRLYLPAEDMARFGVTRDDIAAHRRTDSFLALMDYEAGRAEGFYRAAIEPAKDRKALTAASIMKAIYSRLLVKMRADRFRVFDRRYSLNRASKLWLVLRGWLGWL